MTDGVGGAGKAAVRDMMDRFSFVVPTQFKIAFDIREIGNGAGILLKEERRCKNTFHRFKVGDIVAGKVKDAGRFQHPMDLADEVTGEQTVGTVASFRPRIRAEQMDAVDGFIGQHSCDEPAGFGPAGW